MSEAEPLTSTPQPPELAEKTPLPAQTAVPQQVIAVQPVAVAAGSLFKDYPVWISDGKGNQVQTELRYKNGLLMWLAVGITCLIAGSFGLPCLGVIPLCIKAFKDVEHINPVNGEVVGCYNRGREVGLK